MDANEIGERLDTLAAKIAQGDAQEAAGEYWKTFFSVEKLCFVTARAPDGGLPDPTSMPLLNFRDGDRRILAIYTDSQRANRGAHAAGMVGEDGSAAIIEMPLVNAVEYVCSHWPGAEAFLVNHVPGEAGGYGNRIPDLASFYDSFVGVLPLGCLDAISTAAAESGHPRAYVGAYRAIAASDQVYVGMRDKVPACVPVGDELMVTLFSAHERANPLRAQAPDLSLTAIAPAEIPELVRRMEKASEGKVRGAVMNLGTTPLGINPDIFAKALAGPSGA